MKELLLPPVFMGTTQNTYVDIRHWQKFFFPLSAWCCLILFPTCESGFDVAWRAHLVLCWYGCVCAYVRACVTLKLPRSKTKEEEGSKLLLLNLQVLYSWWGSTMYSLFFFWWEIRAFRYFSPYDPCVWEGKEAERPPAPIKKKSAQEWMWEMVEMKSRSCSLPS